MSITHGTKKWWIVHVAAGVAVVALMAFGVTQCSSKQSERDEKETKQSELLSASGKMERAAAQIDSLMNVNRGLGNAIRAKNQTIQVQGDSIAVLNDSIAVLNDSLAVVNDKLTDCRNGKKQPVAKKPVAKKSAPVKKPVETKPVSVKKDTVVVVVKPCGDGNTNIKLDNSQNNGAIVVSEKKCNNGTDIKLENGSVNNGAIVVGNNNHVVVNRAIVADTLARFNKTRTVVVECEVKTKNRVYY